MVPPVPPEAAPVPPEAVLPPLLVLPPVAELAPAPSPAARESSPAAPSGGSGPGFKPNAAVLRLYTSLFSALHGAHKIHYVNSVVTSVSLGRIASD